MRLYAMVGVLYLVLATAVMAQVQVQKVEYKGW